MSRQSDDVAAEVDQIAAYVAERLALAIPPHAEVVDTAAGPHLSLREGASHGELGAPIADICP